MKKILIALLLLPFAAQAQTPIPLLKSQDPSQMIATINSVINVVNSGTFTNPSGVTVNVPGGLPFQLTARTVSTVSVPTLYPVAPNSLVAFDLSPNGNPSDVGYGKAWSDICNVDVIKSGSSALQCIHMGSGTNQQFGVAEYNSGTMPNFFIGQLNGDTATFTSSITIIGADGSVRLPVIGADTLQTDATVCERISDHQLMSGTGTAGVCLGTSSARFKHNIADLGDGLKQVMELRPVSYQYNEDHGDPNKTLYGFTAEDMEKAIPKLVGHDEQGLPNNADYLGVVPVLVKAVQEQQREIDRLKSRWCVGPFCWG
jgi:hypothetical protein